MKIETLSSLSSVLYHQSLRLYECVAALAQTEHRCLNAAMRQHALALLRHSAVGVPVGADPNRRALRFAGGALAKLMAVFDAARLDQGITEAQYEEARNLIAATARELDALRAPEQPVIVEPEVEVVGPEDEVVEPVIALVAHDEPPSRDDSVVFEWIPIQTDEPAHSSSVHPRAGERRSCPDDVNPPPLDRKRSN